MTLSPYCRTTTGSRVVNAMPVAVFSVGTDRPDSRSASEPGGSTMSNTSTERSPSGGRAIPPNDAPATTRARSGDQAQGRVEVLAGQECGR